jgi:hypothetical protein
MATTKIVSKRVADLVQDPRNARRHSERNMDAIKHSLSRFGQQKPIVILPDGQIVAGNGTVTAARDLGWKHVDAVTFTGSEEEDNRTAELASWDVEELTTTLGEFDSDLIEAAGWSLDEIEFLLTPSGDEDGDRDGRAEDTGALLDKLDVTVAEPAHQPEHGTVWALGHHILVVARLRDETNLWSGYLGEGRQFAPYPDPYLTFTDTAREFPLLLVQPNKYLAGHLLDKHESGFPGTVSAL